MTWNYRLVRYRDGGGFGLHEVHYDERGAPWAMTETPAGFACDEDEGHEGVIKSLQMAIRDATEKPVFDEPEKWPGTPPGRSI